MVTVFPVYIQVKGRGNGYVSNLYCKCSFDNTALFTV